jgi:hypothetical protein
MCTLYILWFSIEIELVKFYTKGAGGVAQAIEHLLCKHEAVRSKPSPT